MSLLDKAANVAIVVVCAAIAGDIALRHFRPQPAQAQGPQRPPEYKPGEVFPAIDGFRQEPGKSALLLFVRSTCRYCADSVPFYQELVKEVRASKAQVQVVGVCLEPGDKCAEFFESHEIALDTTVGAPQGVPRIAGTPTLVMLDQAAKVKQVWIGALAAAQQKAVIRTATTGRAS